MRMVPPETYFRSTRDSLELCCAVSLLIVAAKSSRANSSRHHTLGFIDTPYALIRVFKRGSSLDQSLRRRVWAVSSLPLQSHPCSPQSPRGRGVGEGRISRLCAGGPILSALRSRRNQMALGGDAGLYIQMC